MCPICTCSFIVWRMWMFVFACTCMTHLLRDARGIFCNDLQIWVPTNHYPTVTIRKIKSARHITIIVYIIKGRNTEIKKYNVSSRKLWTAKETCSRAIHRIKIKSWEYNNYSTTSLRDVNNNSTSHGSAPIVSGLPQRSHQSRLFRLTLANNEDMPMVEDAETV